MAPQIILISMYALGLGVTIARHGKPREPHDAWVALFGLVVQFLLLWWGGFFDVFSR